MIEHIINSNTKIFIFAKDKNFKYLYFNEAAAEVAGLDSPSQAVGKTDYDFSWKPEADLYRNDDTNIFLGKTFVNVLAPITLPTRIATILQSKTILTDKNGNPCGITGHSIDITGYTITKNNDRIAEKEIFYLGENFNNEYLTKHEFSVFKELLSGKNIEKIAFTLKYSIKNIRSHVKSIAHKLQCTHQSEIVPTAVKYGLTYLLDDINLSISPSNSKQNDPHLTQRQIDCLIHLVKGKTIKQIAQALYLSAKTVEHYLNAIKSKMGAQDRSEVIEKALQLTSIREQL